MIDMAHRRRRARYHQRSALYQLGLTTSIMGVSGTTTLINAFIFSDIPLIAGLWIPVGVLMAFGGVWLTVHGIDEFNREQQLRHGGSLRANPLWALVGWGIALVGPPALIYFSLL